MKKTIAPLYDILGISNATICLVHCLIFPLLAILPLSLIHNSYIDFVFASIGLFAVFKIIKESSLLISSILIVSMVLIWISVLTEFFLDVHLNLILIGGIGMVIGHFLNYKSHKNRNYDTAKTF
ncbi:MerC domain-containing protein [Flavobacterium sp.]|uniref:MerC domain-containing protein n=1 Tax=Flavobacterium sp. TaxID=239 RepID=UPI003266CDBF